jgi:hypothetical protein
MTPERDMKTTPRRPGDLILDRILPKGTPPEKREEAREALRRYGLALLRLGERIEHAQKFDASNGVDSDREGARTEAAEG